MNFRQRLANAGPSRETVVTVGVFDGVHQGHRHLLRQVVELARSRYIPTVVTFSNRPITVLRPGTEPSYLTSLDQRVDLIKQQGIELVVCLDFTLELAAVSYGLRQVVGRFSEDEGTDIGSGLCAGEGPPGGSGFHA